MEPSCVVVFIARPEIASALRKRFGQHRSVHVFRDSESIRAVQMIVEKSPEVIALDPAFAATSRGAVLIARVRAVAGLASTSLHLLGIQDHASFMKALQALPAALDAAIAAVSSPLEWCGTRRAPRFTITAGAPAAVNGEPSQLVNLSANGVQVVSKGRLRPTEGFRLTLSDEVRQARFHAIVAWSTLELSGTDPAYRAGAQFVSSDPEMIEEYRRRYGTTADQIFVVPADRHPSADSLEKTPIPNAPSRKGARRHARQS